MRVHLFLLLFLCASIAFSQKKTKSDLEKEKLVIRTKIIEAEKILSETQTRQKVSVGELNALKNLIQFNLLYSDKLNIEIDNIKKGISGVENEIANLNANLTTLREQYSEMLYATQKTINDQEQLVFIFSADNYNQLSLRIGYLKVIREARKRQFNQIVKIKEQLVKEQKNLTLKRKEKHIALDKISHEKEHLDSLNDEQWVIIELLSEQEHDIRLDITKYQQEQDKVDNLIQNIIKEEIARKKLLEKERLAEEHRRARLKNKNFKLNKGRLSWPIEKGFISRKFGPQEHPSIPGIKVNNPGIGLQTQKGAKVKAVFEGKVMTVAEIPGAGKLVMISHGDYYTVYSKLKSVSVQKGEKVSFGQELGIVNTTRDGVTELGFQIWREMEKENPENWLIKGNI
jgi:septal ring factor EnvC (AmiA/AmiB activator)